MYGRQVPPGFAPINPPHTMGDPHDYPIAEKPAYASNLFNQPTVERRYPEPSGNSIYSTANISHIVSSLTNFKNFMK